MQAVAELAPLVAFIIAYALGGVYVATAVLMVAMVLLLVADWLRLRRIPPMHGASAVLVVIFGSATLILHDKQFIQWKPTVLFWLTALTFLGSFWIGKQTLAERMLGAALGEHLRVSARQWRVINWGWVLINFLLGALNVVVLRYLSERVWVALKPVDIVIVVLFVLAQVTWLARNSQPQTEPSA
jgi:intracellular septation protein